MPVSLNYSLATPTVINTGEPRLVYALFEFQGEQENSALPVNIALIIDVSNSMRVRLITNQQFAQLVRAGQAQEVITDGVPAYQITSVSNDLIKQYPRRLDYVAQALRIVGEYLRPSDRFSVTAFADQSADLIPSSPGSDRARLRQAAQELEYLNLGDGTNIAAGIASAFTQMQSDSRPQYAKRLVLLTDGHTRRVDECYAWARRAREVSLPLTTLGVGIEFNEDLLIPLADMTGGNAFYIESPDQIPDVFRKELGVAFRISLRDLQLQLHKTQEVNLRRIYRVTPELGTFDRVSVSGDMYQLSLGDFDPAAPTSFLLEFIIPGWDTGSHRIASANISWLSQDGETRATTPIQDIRIQVAESTPEVQNQRVLKIAERVGAYRFGMNALQEAHRSEDRKSVSDRLRQAARRLQELGETALAEQLISQADLVERTGNLDANVTKKLRYQTRQLTGNLVQ